MCFMTTGLLTHEEMSFVSYFNYVMFINLLKYYLLYFNKAQIVDFFSHLVELQAVTLIV